MAAGVLTKVDTVAELTDALFDGLYAEKTDATRRRLQAFYDAHAGATQRTLDALPKLIEGAHYDE